MFRVQSLAAMSCGVGRRHGSDLVLLWLWRRLAAAAPIRPLAWQHPYALGVALKSKKKTKNKKPKQTNKNWTVTSLGRGGNRDST